MKRMPVLVFVLLVVVLSVVMTYPLITDMTGAVAGPPGDNFEYVYKLWWFEHALFEQQQSPFFLPQVFYPFGYELALSETTLANTILGLPLTAAFGEVAAYNLLILWSFALSGMGAYLLARRLTRSSTAALIAGLAFAFLPYRLSLVGSGHLPLLGTGWLPLMLLYEENLIQGRRLRDGVLCGLFFGLFALSSWYYAYMGALVAVAYAVLRARPLLSLLREPRFWRSFLPGAVVAALVMAPALIPFLSLSARGEISKTTLSLQYIDTWSASLPDFLFPSIMHPLWGERLVGIYPQNVHENLLWLGLVPLLLAGYAVVHRRSPIVSVLAIIGVLGLVLAMGTTVHWAGNPVYIPVPDGVERIFTRLMNGITGKLALNPALYSSMQKAGYIVVPLPTLALYLFLPFFSAMRVWTRFGLVVGLAVALLAGAGAGAITRWPRWTKLTRSVLVVALVAGILFDFATVPYPFGVSAIGPQPVDEWLKAQPGDFAILELPPAKTWHGPPLYASIVHGKKIAYGYGTYMPVAYRAWQKRLANFPDEESLAAIREAGIRYVLVGLHSYGQREAAMRQRLAATPWLRLVYTEQDRPVLSGDRLINLVRPSGFVPPTEMIGSVRYAYLVDEIAVYEIVD